MRKKSMMMVYMLIPVTAYMLLAPMIAFAGEKGNFVVHKAARVFDNSEEGETSESARAKRMNGDNGNKREMPAPPDGEMKKSGKGTKTPSEGNMKPPKDGNEKNSTEDDKQHPRGERKRTLSENMMEKSREDAKRPPDGNMQTPKGDVGKCPSGGDMRPPKDGQIKTPPNEKSAVRPDRKPLKKPDEESKNSEVDNMGKSV